MNRVLRRDAETITRFAIEAVKPDAGVKRALAGMEFPGKIYLVAVGKAAWQMAKAALEVLENLEQGIVITKYDHVIHPLPGVQCFEAGHPVPDENGFAATRAALRLTENLEASDTVLFLLSGGGSALFEEALVPLEELQDITGQLLAAGAEIQEINTIRKRLSRVKGGKFALHCAPARVEAIVLSDVVGDRLDMIASGPAAQDLSTAAEALAIARKYDLHISDRVWELLGQETVRHLTNVRNHVTGSVRELIRAAGEKAMELGYDTEFVSDCLTCEARDAGRMLARLGLERLTQGRKLALLAGGETVVHLTGKGKGGRNQELALAGGEVLAGHRGICIISLGSDGTDGPTDAAGGYADGDTKGELEAKGLKIPEILVANDAYHGLQAVDGLVFTGPTGTNVNDISLVLIQP